MTQSTIESSIVQTNGQPERKPIKVLHVDDDLGFLKVSNQILENTGGFEVDTATSVEEAREKMGKNTYDIIVSDYQMPEKDGLQFLKELREAGNQIPFIIFTGKGREQVAIKALNLGADQYLNKIGGPETVYTELEYAIRKTVKSKRGEETQESVQKRLANVFAASPDAITVTDLTGKIVECNKATLELYGFSSKDEVIGRNAFEHIVESDRQRAVKNMKKVLEQDSIKNVEYTSLRRDGSTFTAELSASVIRDSSGKPKGFVGIIKDITERKKAAEALKESEKRFRAVFEGATDGILAADTVKQRFVFANPRLCEITGYSLEELLKLGVSDIHPKEDLPYVNDQFTKQVEEKLTLATDIPVLRKDKQVAYCDVNSKILEIGKQQYLVGFFRDTTERKKTEEALRESEEKYRTIVESATDAIFEFNEDGELLTVNQKAAKMLGVKPENLTGKKMHDLFPTAIADEQLESVQAVFQTGNPVLNKESWTKTKSGLRWASTSLIPVKSSSGKIVKVLGFSQDVTERKKMEDALILSEERYRNIVDLAPAGIMTLDLKGVLTSANSTFLKLTGFSRNEIVDKHFTKLGTLRARDIPRYAKIFSSILRGKLPPPSEFPFTRKNGTTGWAEAHFGFIKKKGKIVGFQAYIRETSDRKKSLDKLKALNEKLEVVGGLTRHDVRNKLSTVQGRIFLAKQKLSGNVEAEEDLVEAQRAIVEAERILSFAGEYENLGMEELTYVSIGNNVKEAVSLLPGAGAELEGIKITDDCEGMCVLADSMLRQLFYNLIDNSVKHGGHVSQIRIGCETGKKNLKLLYEDNGVGVPKAEREKIFEKGYGKGSGYGLYLIKKMCEVYGWNIKETGKQGKGAQFTITIPKLNEQGKANYKLN